jgi:hypothetical protein
MNRKHAGTNTIGNMLPERNTIRNLYTETDTTGNIRTRSYAIGKRNILHVNCDTDP